MKKIIVILFFLIFIYGCSYIPNSLEEYALNPDRYINQTLSFKAKVINYGSPDVNILEDYGISTYYYNFVDDKGYSVMVISKKRSFEMNKIYEVNGTFIKTSYGEYYLIENENDKN